MMRLWAFYNNVLWTYFSASLDVIDNAFMTNSFTVHLNSLVITYSSWVQRLPKSPGAYSWNAFSSRQDVRKCFSFNTASRADIGTPSCSSSLAISKDRSWKAHSPGSEFSIDGTRSECELLRGFIDVYCQRLFEEDLWPLMCLYMYSSGSGYEL